MGFVAQFQTVTNLSSWRISLSVFPKTLYLLSVCQVSRAGKPVSGMLAPPAMTLALMPRQQQIVSVLLKANTKCSPRMELGPFFRRSMVSVSPGLCGGSPTEPLKSTEPKVTAHPHTNLTVCNLSPTCRPIFGYCN